MAFPEADLNPKQCATLLTTEHYGHLGCVSDDDVYVLPATYAFKANAIYSYTHEGKKVQAMRENPRVCFQVERVDMPKGWESVVCWGTYEELTDNDDRREAQLLLAEKFAEIWKKHEKIMIVSPLITDLNEICAGKPGVLYRINIDRMTGKRREYK